MTSCGGGGSSANSAAVPSQPQQPPQPPQPPSGPGNVAGSNITDFKIESTANTDQLNVPFTIGQVFAPGDLPVGNNLFGSLPDGSKISLQLDVKATHSDGSIRHAILSGILPKLNQGQSTTITINKTTQATVTGNNLTLADLVASGLDSTVTATVAGQAYSASLAALLKNGQAKTWISGPIAGEWIVLGPLTTAAGAAHPHLTAQFAVRRYAGTNATRVDVTVENGWAYQASPQNFTYDAQIQVAGQNVYSKSGLTHYSHARWRKTFWANLTPQAHVRHNTAYLINSRAVPNYDQSLVIPEATLASWLTNWQKSNTDPMGMGLAQSYMPTTGGRPDIGLLPGWEASYLLSMDKRLKDVTLGTADLAGSWSIHYRDQNTGRPVSVLDFPYMTILGNPGDTFNPVTKKYESFPTCSGDCANNVNTADSAHEPSFNYLPYIVTGDYFQLEELEFWAMWNVFKTNPGYRGNIAGLIHQAQVRDQAWSLRTMADAAYILPDQDSLKVAFNTFVKNNIAWYLANYVSPSGVNNNSFGALVGDSAIGYNNNTGIAPWMDDFFTSAVGHVIELGFVDAKPLLVWKAQFPIARMTDPGFCWIFGAIYSLNIRDTQTSPLYTNYQQAYLASQPANITSLPCAGDAMAAALQLKTGEMTGYSSEPTGFPSNMQPALAYSADSGATNGAKAWSVFSARAVKPDYTTGPQFAIIPR